MPLRFLALGDSYTIGEGVPLSEGWPAQLSALLNESGLLMDEPVIVAKTGWTTEELLSSMHAADLAPPYDLVTLLVGVNNQYRKQDIQRYEKEFDTLLTNTINLAGGDSQKTIVLSIPDWSVTPYASDQSDHASLIDVARTLDKYNEINCRLAYRRGCTYVDVTGLTREHKNDPHAWAEDGLHPATLMYTQWARKLQPIVLRLFKG